MRKKPTLAEIDKLLTRLYVKTGGKGPLWAKVKREVRAFVRAVERRCA